MTTTTLTALQRAQQLAAQVAVTQDDMNEATKGGGGGGRRLPMGTARARFVGYIELGQHIQKVKGVPKEKPDELVLMAFALWGRGKSVNEKGEPLTDEQGKFIMSNFENDDGTPAIRWLPYPLGLYRNEKAKSFQMFKRMNYKGTAKQFIGLLGEEFLLPCTYELSADKSKAYFTMQTSEIKPPYQEDLETGESNKVNVPAAPDDAYTYFLWDNPDQDDLLRTFHDLYVEGKWDDGKSKNKFQEQILAARNIQGSPILNALQASGANIELPSLEAPETPAAATSPASVPQAPAVTEVPAAPAVAVPAVPSVPAVPDVPAAPAA